MAGKTTLNKKIVSDVKAYAARLHDAGIPTSKVIVFGSRAKGKAKKWSDTDVGIVSEKFGRSYHDELVMLLKLRGTRFAGIEPHPFSPRDLNDPLDPLAAEVRKHGIRVG